jgi:tRNA (guanine37-N1)-methyltransferase
MSPASATEERIWRAGVLTLYPEMFPGPLGLSLAGKALAERIWSLQIVNIRDFASDRHRTVDDTPAGGGPGMVMRADVLARAIDAACPPGDERPRLLMSPRGRPLDQARVRALAAGPGVLVVAGRFEGVDERVIEARQLEEISIGDYVLSGGELAAMVLLDAAVRLLPGVMGNAASSVSESFADGLLEYPQYTRPQDFEGRQIPEVLLSGDHARIARWRREQAERLTAARRPDLMERAAREADRRPEPAGIDKPDRLR